MAIETRTVTKNQIDFFRNVLRLSGHNGVGTVNSFKRRLPEIVTKQLRLDATFESEDEAFAAVEAVMAAIGPVSGEMSLYDYSPLLNKVEYSV